MTTYKVVDIPARCVRPGDVIEISAVPFGNPRLCLVTRSYVWTTGQTRIIEYRTIDDGSDNAMVSEDQMIPVLVRQS